MTELVPATVRLARVVDAKRVADLCVQLGYSRSEKQVRQHLEQILPDERHAVYVAVLPNGQVVGWVHVYTCQLVMTDLQAEIGGLIVDNDHRCCGIGQRLMHHAEEWACKKGCRAVFLRSNMTRKQAHIFYERMGYSHIKTSLAFHKVL